jgi:polysaccharide deacetylase family protein (PEP-CTERM system associated)
MKNALTIDLEDWYHPELVKRRIQGDPAPQVVDAAHCILDLLSRQGVRATFFILGDVARKHPDLVRAIGAQGHEIASHGVSHTPLWDLDYESLDRELKSFRAIMAEILGPEVSLSGFRAPTFSMDNRTRYAMKCLVDNGYRYDTSIFPAKNHVYGMSDAPCTPYRPDLNDLSRPDPRSDILEFPLTIFEWGKFRIPVSGGFYLRVFPYLLLRTLLRKINRTRPFVIYFHPWEVCPETPRVRGIGLKNTLITYYGMKTAFRKIERLLRDFKFEPMIDVIQRAEREGHAIRT